MPETAARQLEPVLETDDDYPNSVLLKWLVVLANTVKVEDYGSGPEVIDWPIYGETVASVRRPLTEFIQAWREGVDFIAYVEKYLPRPAAPSC